MKYKNSSWNKFITFTKFHEFSAVYETLNLESLVNTTIFTDLKNLIDNFHIDVVEGSEQFLFVFDLFNVNKDDIEKVKDFLSCSDFNKCHSVIFSNNGGIKSNSSVSVQHVPSSNYNEFLKKIARHFEIMINEVGVAGQVTEKKSFPTKHIYCKEISDKHIIFNEKYLLTFDDKFDMLISLKSNSKKLVVMGQDAIHREKTNLPKFFRWSWIDELPFSVIILNDPTLYLDSSLDGGWYVGNKQNDFVVQQVNLLKEFVYLIDSSIEVTFFGVSAGGFSSLMFASEYGYNAKCVVDIPQINLTTYHKEEHVSKLLQVSFDATLITLPSEYNYRVNVINRFARNGFIPKTLYLYNVLDTSHRNQIDYFFKGCLDLCAENKMESDRITFLPYKKWHLTKGGHFPMDKKRVISELINFVYS